MTTALIALAAAMLVLPSSPRRRLLSPGVQRAMPPRLFGLAAVSVAACAAVMLTLSTVVAAGIVCATVVLRRRRRQRGDRSARESRQLETAIDVLVGELRVGAHPAAAFAVAAAETAEPVAGAFRAVAARARLWADVGAGLRGVGDTSTLPRQWDRLAVCWQLAADHGLAMSALMRAAQRDIVERQRFSGHVRSAMAGARATASILAGLPVLAVGLGQLIGAHPLAFLLGGRLGGSMLIVGLTLMCTGLLWADRITDRVTA